MIMNSMKKTILSLLALIMACTLQAQSTQTLYKATPRANSKIYVQDNTGWNDLSLYAWIGSGENGNMKPWPGIHYTGVTTIAGNPYKVLEMTSSYEGQPLNWIFNNNNGGKQFDAMKNFTLTDDLYMRITATGYELLANPDPIPAVAPVYGTSTAYDNVGTKPLSDNHRVIYQLNLYDFTAEGTFAAAQARLDELQKLGIDIVWLMPIFPRSNVNKWGTLGSPYAPKSYYKTNPDHGTMEDFKAFVIAAHQRGMKVWLDWVPNHTAMDADWITEHPEYYYKENGNFYHPSSGSILYGDVYQLDMRDTNPATQQAMTDAMCFWVDTTDVDGFRCDFISSPFIPTSFWLNVIPELRKHKPSVEVMAEADLSGSVPRLLPADWDFDYAWGFEENLEQAAKLSTGEGITVKSYLASLWNNTDYGNGIDRMVYLDNHDRNADHGTVKARFGNKLGAYYTLQFTAYGMPLIYNGDETGYDKVMPIVEILPIDWTYADPQIKNTVSTLVALKHTVPALANGTLSERGSIRYLSTDNGNVLAYERSNGDSRALVILNFGSQSATVAVNGVYAGNYTQLLNSETISQGTSQRTATLSESTRFSIPAYGYYVYVK